MKRKHLKLALWGTASLLVALIVAAAYAATRFTLQPTSVGGDYLVMGPTQAKECEDGGGCAIFSEREFLAALSKLMQRNKQTWRDGA